MASSAELYNLLVVEDDLSEQKLIKMMVNKSGYSFSIKFINDGEQAVNYVNSFPNSESEFSKIHLIFIDLNLPKVSGINVLKAIKGNIYLFKTPVVVLTTSDSKSDVSLAYEAGASGFVIKPSVIDDYENTIRKILEYWIGICLIP